MTMTKLEMPNIEMELPISFHDLTAGVLNCWGQFKNNSFTEMCSGSEAGSYLRLIDFCNTLQGCGVGVHISGGGVHAGC